MGDWKTVMEPILKRLDVASKFDGMVRWDAKGSAAMAGLIRQMIDIIDNQIEGRREGCVGSQLHAREVRLFGSVANDWSKEELLLVIEWHMLQQSRTYDAERRIKELRSEIIRIAEERKNGKPV